MKSGKRCKARRLRTLLPAGGSGGDDGSASEAR